MNNFNCFQAFRLAVLICVQPSFQAPHVFNLLASNEVTLFTSVTSQSCLSEASCAVQCSQRSDCLTFRYSADTSVCYMSNEAPGGLGLGVAVFSIDLSGRPELSQCKRIVASASSQLFCPFQQRTGGSVDFQQSWSNYEIGFGDNVNYWIGLQSINQLTSPNGSTIVIDIVTCEDVRLHQEYTNFYVRDNSTKYNMTVGSMITANSNLTVDNLPRNSAQMFSTKDSDNDSSPGVSCSTAYHGSAGWWFKSCGGVNPNGNFPNPAICLMNASLMTWQYNTSWVAHKAIRLMLLV